MTQPAARHNQLVGQLAEKLVAQWLRQQGWTILHERWHCRWGELDLIAHPPIDKTAASPLLVFVEVKARGDRNWDHDGLLALTPQKQAKLWRTAELFLAEHPEFAEAGCRFDAVLVTISLAPRRMQEADALSPIDMDEAIAQLPVLEIGQAAKIHGFYLKIQQHLTDLFT